ncbi:MAG TPA: hypothetical protein VMW41_06180 [Candidatus Bathyarchaeia archaeon]|nr:hypothetical protein [Candidatus Bathyarchaeia archaeon]
MLGPRIIFGAAEDIEKTEQPIPQEIAPPYAEIVKMSPRASRWYEFMMQESQRPNFEGWLRSRFCEQYALPGRSLAGAKFALEPVSQITDGGLLVPVFEFRRQRHYQSFLRRTDLSLVQGTTLALDVEEDMRPLSIVFVCAEYIRGHLEPRQIKRHEKIHATDPLIYERKTSDAPALNELIAVIGEVTDPEGDLLTVDSIPGFWRQVFRDVSRFSPSLMKILATGKKTEYPIDELVSSMCQFVKDITRNRSNRQVVRMIMSCRDFDELIAKLYQVYPEIFKSEGLVD